MARTFLTVYLKDITRGVFKMKKDVRPGTYFMVLSTTGNNGKSSIYLTTSGCILYNRYYSDIKC